MDISDGGNWTYDQRFRDTRWTARLPVRESWRREAARAAPAATTTVGNAADAPGFCVWAAEIAGRIVGLLAMAPRGKNLAQIEWFRIEPDWQHTVIVAKLIGKLHEHCHAQGYRRLILDVSIAPQWVWRTLAAHGFRLVRRIRGPQSEVFEFALDPPKSAKS